MKKKRRLGLLSRAGLVTLAVVFAAALVVLVPGTFGGNVTGAGFTTVNPAQDPGVLCLNGNPLVNCNIYTDKEFVWLNGGPDVAYVGDGDYFFAILAPGGQHDPLDGSANNLSDTTAAPWSGGETNSDGSTVPSGDTYKNRTFTVSTDSNGNKVVSYTGNVGHVDPLDDETPHDFDPANNKIRLMPYDDTPNNGGVYIMAICSLKDGYAAVTPSNCKYDAFKVQEGETTVPEADAPSVTKDADGSYKTTWTWDLAKSVDKTRVDQTAGSSATFSYTVTATHSAGTNSDIKVTGHITVTNPNAESIEVSVSDDLSDPTNCTVKDGLNLITSSDLITVPGSGDTGNRLTYSCPIGGTSVPTNLTNTVTVKWPQQILDDGSHLAGNSTGITYTYPADGSYIQFAQTKVDNCETLTDTFDGTLTTLGVACVGNSPVFAIGAGNTLANWNASYLSPTFTFTYRHTVTVPSLACRTYTNAVDFTTNTSGVHDINSVTVDTRSVVVCPKVNGLTIGYWQNKNGQARIIGTGSSGNCTALHNYLVPFNPFKDIDTIPISNTNSTLKYGTACGTSAGYTQNKSTASSGIAGYVYDVIKAANASGASMNAMLKAQMLATALNVYVGVTPGGLLIDLTKICHMIDGSGGTATCSGVYTDTSLYPAVFGGATSLTVSQILAYAASQSNPGGSLWYGNVKSVQEKAKDTFDAINNGVAFSA